MIPAKFTEKITTSWGEEAAGHLVSALQTPSPVSIRLHPRKAGNTFDTFENIPWCPLGKYLPERPVFTLDPLFHAGAYYVQEPASMFIWQVLQMLTGSEKEIKVLDLCGAPGGKSSLIASYLDGRGLLVANEVIKSRAYVLKANLEKSGYSNCIVTNNDPKDYAEMTGFFDIILIDAPCSGEGMFRKDPLAAGEWSEENVSLCSARQKRILADVYPCLKEGGNIIYSTCTFNDDENIHNAVWACDNLDMESMPVPSASDFGLMTVRKNDVYGYQFSPHLHRSEGLFISVMKKKQGTTPRNLSFSKKNQPVPPDIRKALSGYIDIPSNKTVFSDPNEEIHLFPTLFYEGLLMLSQYTRVIMAGVNLGKMVRCELLPNHALALAIDITIHFQRAELTREESLLFLKKELTEIPGINKGWTLVTYKNLGLGWVKNIGSRINNYLPNEARIRMDIPESTEL